MHHHLICQQKVLLLKELHGSNKHSVCQSIDYTVLGLINVQVSVSDAVKLCTWCDESFAPTGLPCKPEFVIGTSGFAGKAEVQPEASVGITCLATQCRE